MENDKETISLKKIIIYYLHYWKLFMATFAVALIPAILYLVFYPKTYEVFASIQLQDERNLMSTGSIGLSEAAGLMKSFGLGGTSAGGINIDDELAVLTSTNLTNKMILSLGLNVEYYKPFSWKHKLYKNSPFLITADSSVFTRLKEVITLNVNSKNGKITVKTKVGKRKKKTFAFDSLPAVLDMEEGKFRLSYSSPEMVSPVNTKMEIKIWPSLWAAEDLAEDISIEEYSKSSNVIELTYRDHEKQRGMDMFTSLITHYNSRADVIKKEECLKALAFLNGRMSSISDELIKVEQKIEDYKIKNKLTDLEYDILFYTEQMKEIQGKIIEIEAQSHVINMMDAYIKDPVNKYNLIPTLLSSQEGGDVAALNIYNEALIERSRLLKNSNEDNPLIKNWNDKIDQLRQSVFLTISNAQRGLDITIADLKRKEQALYGRMSDVPKQEREYVDYKRQQEILQGVYLIILQKREEIALILGQDKAKARIVDEPFAKQRPVAPRKLFAAIGIFLFTLLIPAGYLFIKKQLVSLHEEYKENY